MKTHLLKQVAAGALNLKSCFGLALGLGLLAGCSTMPPNSPAVTQAYPSQWEWNEGMQTGFTYPSEREWARKPYTEVTFPAQREWVVNQYNP